MQEIINILKQKYVTIEKTNLNNNNENYDIHEFINNEQNQLISNKIIYHLYDTDDVKEEIIKYLNLNKIEYKKWYKKYFKNIKSLYFCDCDNNLIKIYDTWINQDYFENHLSFKNSILKNVKINTLILVTCYVEYEKSYGSDDIMDILFLDFNGNIYDHHRFYYKGSIHLNHTIKKYYTNVIKNTEYMLCDNNQLFSNQMNNDEQSKKYIACKNLSERLIEQLNFEKYYMNVYNGCKYITDDEYIYDMEYCEYQERYIIRDKKNKTEYPNDEILLISVFLKEIGINIFENMINYDIFKILKRNKLCDLNFRFY